MTLENIANEDLALGHGLGSLISGGVFTIVSSPSPKAWAEGKQIHTDPLQFSFSGGNASGFVDGTVATVIPADMPATAIKSKARSFAGPLEFVMREGDSVTMDCVGTLDPTPPPPASPSGPVAGLVVIDDAGQQKWKAQ